MRKGTWITLLIIIFVIAISYYAMSKNGHNTDNEFANCISGQATLYMQTGCFACVKQEEVFGESYKDLKVVNCAEDPSVCATEGIERTPTWVINYEKYIGYKTIDELSELTSCELKEVENEIAN